MNGNHIKRFRHTGIIVKDMEESVKFYQEILGCKIAQDFTDDSDYINTVLGIKKANIRMVKMLTKDDIMIELLEYVTHPTGIPDLPFYHTGICHIAFEVKDIDKLYESLISNRIEVISKPLLSSEGFAKVCFCVDPNGVRIELVEILSQSN